MKKSHNALLCISVSGKNPICKSARKTWFSPFDGAFDAYAWRLCARFSGKSSSFKDLDKKITKKYSKIDINYHDKRFMMVKNIYFYDSKIINRYSTFARQGHPQHNIPRFFGRAGRKEAPLPKMFSETSAGCVERGPQKTRQATYWIKTFIQ